MNRPTTIFTPTLIQKKYLDSFMSKVSRSFAILIPYLEDPLNHYLATSYLLCRVVDNIEDCHHTLVWKKARFNEFIELLKKPTRVNDILILWQSFEWTGLTMDETYLMGNQGATLWQIYHLIPEHTRNLITRWTEEMAIGMSKLEDELTTTKFVSQNGVRILATEHDYNRYCYFVAGTVSHLSTELVIQHYNLNNQNAINLTNYCEACGRGLQKTNIIKDFAKDLNRGICYIPDIWLAETIYSPLRLIGAGPKWISKILLNVADELLDASNYILALPYHASGYRMACLLCLLPAFQTLYLAGGQQEKLFTAEHQLKISRLTMERCIADAGSMLHDNDALLQYCHHLHEAIADNF